MTVEDLKNFIKLSRNDSIVYKRNGEEVIPDDWDGCVQYNIDLW